MSDQRTAIFTMRMSDSGPIPDFLGESHIGACGRCGEPVWVSSTTIPKMEEYPNHQLICNICAPDVIEEMDLSEVDFQSADPRLQRFSDENKDDLLEWIRKRGRE